LSKEASAHSQQWAKSAHLVRMQQSGHFRYVKEVVLHQIEQWTAERWVGYALSCMPGVLDSGASVTEVGLDELH